MTFCPKQCIDDGVKEILTDLGRPCRCCPQEKGFPGRKPCSWDDANFGDPGTQGANDMVVFLSKNVDDQRMDGCWWQGDDDGRFSSMMMMTRWSTWSGYQTMIWSFVSPGAWISSSVMPARLTVSRSENTFWKDNSFERQDALCQKDLFALFNFNGPLNVWPIWQQIHFWAFSSLVFIL